MMCSLVLGSRNIGWAADDVAFVVRAVRYGVVGG